jgi:hypothetical protein
LQKISCHTVFNQSAVIFEEVSSCLLSSIPSRVLSAQVMLSITGAILKIEEPNDTSWNILTLDSNSSRSTTVDSDVPNLFEWLPAILYYTEISDGPSNEGNVLVSSFR